MARFDDELWEAVADHAHPPPVHLADFVSGLPSAADVLDVGIGDGRTAALLGAERLVGVDSSRVALERARRRLPEAELVLVAPDEPLPFDDNRFDLVTCIETIEHIRDVQLALSEIRRVLRPGALFALTTPASGRWRLLRHGPEHPFSPHLHAFTKRSLRSTLDAMGFELTDLRRSRGTLFATATR